MNIFRLKTKTEQKGKLSLVKTLLVLKKSVGYLIGPYMCLQLL